MPTCLPCYVAFLDVTGLRGPLQDFIDTQINLPVQSAQDELQKMQSFLNEVNVAYGNWVDEMINVDTLKQDIFDEMSALGIGPGDCPQLDQLIAALETSKNMMTMTFINPLTTSTSVMGSMIGKVSTQVALMQTMINEANNLNC